MACTYTLSSSREPGSIRYVGVTSKTAGARLVEHLRLAKTGRRRLPVLYWIRKELGAGYEILTRTVQTYDEFSDALSAERDLIATSRAEGADLLNITDGGEGTLGVKHSAETRKKISEARQGCATHTKPHTDESKRKISEAKKGQSHPQSVETRDKISAALRGVSRPHAPGWQPPEVSEETRRRMSESAKRRVSSNQRNSSGRFS